MSTGGGDPGYITDVEYTAKFFPHLAPAWLAYIAIINGYSAPVLREGFTWCELGCGKGITPLLLAALHPDGEFHACDILPAHIEYAERLRNDAGLANVHFHARGVGDMLAMDLPKFDFITMHGLYGWVPDAVRAEIRTFLRTRLNPGGLVMVSYNSMPGWAQVQPLRNLMQWYARTRPGDTVTRTREAFAYVRKLADQGAGYFATSPAAVKHLERIAQQDIAYVVHEYLAPYSDPFYFPEMAAAMGDAGLTFAGSMMAADNYTEWMMPQRFAALLARDADRPTLEMHRDFVMNTTFRRDLYAAQPELRTGPQSVPLERFEGLSFSLANLPERLPLQNREGGISYDLSDQAGVVRAIHARLMRGPASAAQLLEATGGTPAQMSLVIQRLVVAQHITPGPPAPIDGGWRDIHSAIVETGLRDSFQQVPLPCPATGLATYAETVYAASAEAAVTHDDADRAARSVLERLRAHKHPVNRQQGTLTRPATDAEIVDAVTATWRQLRAADSADGRLMRMFGILR